MLRSSTRRFAIGGLFSSTAIRRLDYERLDDFYRQEAFESLQKFEASSTYPGSIKAATPGDTANHMSKYRTILEETGDRHYWRPVVDDPEPRRYLTISVRFKESVSIGDRMEQHASIVQTTVPENCTVSELMKSVVEVNQSPYLCINPFTLVIEGKRLHPDMTISEAGLTETTIIDAIDDELDHRLHEEGYRPLNWYEDEMTPEVENKAPYAEMKLTENLWKEMKTPNAYRYKGTKPTSSLHGVPQQVRKS